ncbi:cation:proton antiporter [Bradyrhizobium sp.]|uniref:cation:proton antiporter n=1 Tax=Bradyrhizobium sp. TaxID=376 RepID=UPI0039E2E95D
MAADFLSPAVVAISLGFLILLTAWLPLIVRRLPLSLPIVAVALGVAMSYIPGTERYAGSLFRDAVLEHLTEFVVLIALMGVGLRIERPFSWMRWNLTFRLLVIAMPLTIVAMTVLCMVLPGLPLASALLVAAALAPTDPVLAADVQVGPPGEEEGGEVRFSLTSEAGLNDGLAFPFVALAIGLTGASYETLWKGWLLIVLWKIGCGVTIGYIAGRAFGWLTFKLPRLKLSKTGDGLVAVGVTLLSYGATELAHGYGFVAVFIAAMTLRATDRGHDFHSAMAEFSEQIERVLMVIVLVIFGDAVASGVLTALRWEDALAGAAMLLLIRPITGWIALLGNPFPAAGRALIAFFGIRGLGTFYYLAYAMNRAHFEEAPRLWALASLVVLASVILHGVTSTPVMNWVDRRRQSHKKERERPQGEGAEPGDQPAEGHAA